MRFTRLFAVVVAVAAVAGVVASGAFALAFSDDSCDNTKPCRPPVGTVGASYAFQLKAMENSGNGPPYTFTQQGGSLPPGLSLNSDGLISGRPTQPGSWVFGVLLTDFSGGCAGCGCVSRNTCPWREFTIDVVAGLTINNAPPSAATVGVAYSTDLNADGGGSQTWSVVSGALPPGLALDPGSGVISGTPSQANRYDFSIKVADATRQNTKAFTIVVSNPLALALAPPKVPPAEVGMTKPFELKLTATGGDGTNTWKQEGTLPQGLTFTPPVAPATEATITGTPTAPGSFPVKVTVTDSDGRTTSIDVPIVVAPQLSFATKRLTLVKTGKRFSVTLRTTTGAGTVRFKVTSGKFPFGIRMNKITGTISGKTQKAGVYRFTVEARDALGVTSTQDYILTVKQTPTKKKHG
jgi:hypothetical protein